MTCLTCGKEFTDKESKYEITCSRACDRELDRLEEKAADEYEARTGKDWFTFYDRNGKVMN